VASTSLPPSSLSVFLSETPLARRALVSPEEMKHEKTANTDSRPGFPGQPKAIRIYPNLPEFIRIYPNLSEFTRIYPNFTCQTAPSVQFDPQVRGIQLAFVFDRCRFSRVPWHLFQGFIFRCPYELSSSASIRRGIQRPTHSFLRRGFDICQYGHESPR